MEMCTLDSVVVRFQEFSVSNELLSNADVASSPASV